MILNAFVTGATVTPVQKKLMEQHPCEDFFLLFHQLTTAKSRGHDDGTLRYSRPVYVTLLFFSQDHY